MRCARPLLLTLMYVSGIVRIFANFSFVDALIFLKISTRTYFSNDCKIERENEPILLCLSPEVSAAHNFPDERER